MLELKLAEYKDGKFEGFLKLKEAKLYNMALGHPHKRPDLTEDKGFCLADNCVLLFNNDSDFDIFLKDQKDPLNRFNGLFNGRTYGDGRFVLVEKEKYFKHWQDDFVKRPDDDSIYIRQWELMNKFNGKSLYHRDNLEWATRGDEEAIGNLHENPELWEKVK